MISRAGTCEEIIAKSALHFHESEMPCHWDVNVYRGCSHGCKYCFAQYSHDYLHSGDFFGKIFVKLNIAQVLDKELSRPSWKKPRINLAGVTDCYQPAEAVYKLMPSVLRVLIHHRNPIVLTTKSSLILRDIKLIRELAMVTSVSIGVSITTSDEQLRGLIEPGASPSHERFRVLEACKLAGCKVNILLTPVIPFITDSIENMETIYKTASLIGVNGLSPWPLNLKGNTKVQFYEFLKMNFPKLLPRYQQLYRHWKVEKSYETELRERVLFLRNKYQIPGIKLDQVTQEPCLVQLKLF